MKFLIVLSVLVVCASAKPFFFKHPFLSGLLGGGGGGSSSSAGASSSSYSAPPPEPVFVPAPEPVSSGPAANPLGGLENIIMIPLNIKKSLLQAHQAKFNNKIQQILGTFSKFGSLGGGGSSSSAGASSFSSGNSISGPPAISYPPPIAPAPVSGLSGGNVDYNALGGGESSYSSSGSQSISSGGGLSTGGNVQTYHPQPAPNTNYHSSPIVLYLYPVSQGSSQASAGSSSVDFQPAPVAPQPDCNQQVPVAPQPQPFVPQPQPQPFVPQPQPQPFVPQPQPQPFVPQPQPQPFVPQPQPQPQPQPFIPEPVAPQQTYGPPDFEPAQPISTGFSSGTASSSSFDFEPQVVQPVSQPQNTYLPPYKRRY